MRSDCRFLLLLVLPCLCAAVGCQRTIAKESAVDRYASASTELDYWQQLEDERVLTNNDALHGLLILADGADPSTSYEQRTAAARERGWLRGKTDPPADQSARVGMVAVAVCDILDVKGGVTMHIFPRAPRYCTRELIYMRIMPLRSENQALSGLEFLDLASKVEEERKSASKTTGA